ncbi:patatin-like phospholipase family protein [Segnochrobactraceae bacterium EtOH-i3]
MSEDPAPQPAPGTDSSTGGTATFTFDDIRRRELEREALWQRVDPERPDGAPDRVGLCLSGGGIRSAAFSLGVIQHLHARDIFSRVDYLSTVSGGGYLAASLMAARLRAEMMPDGKPVLKDDKQTPVGPTFPFDVRGSDGSGGVSAAVGITPQDIADTGPVRWLRDHSRFLIPNGSWDVFLSAGPMIRGVVVNLFLLAPYLLALAAFILACLGSPTSTGTSTTPTLPLPVTLISVAVYAVVFGVCWGMCVSRSHSETPRWENRSLWAKLAALALLPLAAIAGLEALVGIARSILSAASSDGSATASLTLTLCGAPVQLCDTCVALLGCDKPPAPENTAPTGSGSATIAWLAAILSAAVASLGFLWKQLGGLIQGASTDPAASATVKAIIARIVSFLLALALPALLCVLVLLLVELGRSQTHWLPEDSLSEIGNIPVGALLYGAAALLAIWLLLGKVRIYCFPSRDPASSEAQDFASKISAFARSRRTPTTSELISLLPLGLALVALAAPLGIGLRAEALPIATPIYVFLIVLLSLCADRFLVNATSLHRLYRDRLEEGFALAWQQPGAMDGPITSIKLTDLQNFYNLTTDDKTAPCKRPYLIANMTLNLAGSRKKVARNRDAEFFSVTADYVGSDATGYVPGGQYTPAAPTTPAEQLDLATVAATSGAAVASRMGRTGFGLFAPTLALLNIRLGFWLRNPKTPPGSGQGAGSKAGLTLLDEITGSLDEDKPLIYLSDGGHIENLGLYQLLKRRCDLIISVDAEADPAMTCGALVDVERLARIDLGVLLETRIAPLRDAALSRRAGLFARPPGAPAPVSDPSCHAIISRIHYPAQTGTGQAKDAPVKTGILVYIKTALTGDEPSYVLDYERRHPTFPHETTGDQFFSEDQFEAYRALGFHAARDALRQNGGDDDRSDMLNDLLHRLGVKRQGLGRD